MSAVAAPAPAPALVDVDFDVGAGVDIAGVCAVVLLVFGSFVASVDAWAAVQVFAVKTKIVHCCYCWTQIPHQEFGG